MTTTEIIWLVFGVVIFILILAFCGVPVDGIVDGICDAFD